MKQETNRGSFSGQLGFIMAAAASAVGLGNIWRFPYLAAKDGGGVFLLFYVILTLTFGFALLTSEVAIGRKTGQSPLTAYGHLNHKFRGLGVLACLVPTIILPYYCAIGGWVLKYLITFTYNGIGAAEDGFFTSFISSPFQPILWMFVFLFITAAVVFAGVEQGIEKFSKILMPILLFLIVGISVFSLTLKSQGEDGGIRTGLQGLKIYLVPNFSGMSLYDIFTVFIDALGQLFYSISVAMGIMVAYGSYAKKETNLISSINQIELFDTLVAMLAGLMIVPAVYVFMGTEGMSGGPGLMFVSLPKVFSAMGTVGQVVGVVFFTITAFAAVTSSVSIMEAIVSSLIDRFGWSRKKSSVIVFVYAVILGTIVCLGYNAWYFEWKLPNGTSAQILDLFDYVSNYWLMPFVALLTCILVGWVVKPKAIIEEVTQQKFAFRRKWLYVAMVKVIAPIMLLLLLVQSTGLLDMILKLFR